jgi:hypothetical protein
MDLFKSNEWILYIYGFICIHSYLRRSSRDVTLIASQCLSGFEWIFPEHCGMKKAREGFTLAGL